MDRKLKKCCRRRVDSISCLPDDILLHILSFLPSFKEAAASTSLVSRRWSDLWKQTPKIDLSYKIGDPNCVNWVNSALELHKAPFLQEFRINCRIPREYDDRDHDHQPDVAKWLEHAFSRRVERLHLDLEAALIGEEVLKGIVGMSSCRFKSLKDLYLGSFQVTAHVLGFFLRNCVSLERLVFFRLRRRGNLEIVGPPSLKHLDMRSRSIHRHVTLYIPIDKIYREYGSIKVVAPNLTWLTLDQNSKVVSLEHVPKLVNLHFFCRFRFGDTMHHIANVAAQLVTLIIHLFDPYPNAKDTFSVPEMPKLKKLVVYYRSTFDADNLPVTRFLSASPSLEEFKLDVSELCGARRGLFAVGPPCLHRNLKLFVFSGFCEVASDKIFESSKLPGGLDLVRYMVDNCVGLKEIVVGECHLVGLVRDIIMNSYDALYRMIVDVGECPRTDAATPQERDAFRSVMELQQIPAHIKLRIVFEDANPLSPPPALGFPPIPLPKFRRRRRRRHRH